MFFKIEHMVYFQMLLIQNMTFHLRFQRHTFGRERILSDSGGALKLEPGYGRFMFLLLQNCRDR